MKMQQLKVLGCYLKQVSFAVLMKLDWQNQNVNKNQEKLDKRQGIKKKLKKILQTQNSGLQQLQILPRGVSETCDSENLGPGW